MSEEKLEGCNVINGTLAYPEITTEDIYDFKFKYYLEPKKEYEKLRFLSRDIFGILSITNPEIEDILIITEIDPRLIDYSDKPDSYVNFFLREFAERHSDKLIALQLYVKGNTEEEAILYQNTTFIELIIDLEEAGFVDINSYCKFKNSAAFVYRNEYSQGLLRFVTRMGIRDNNINNIELEFADYAQAWYGKLPEKFTSKPIDPNETADTVPALTPETVNDASRESQ